MVGWEGRREGKPVEEVVKVVGREDGGVANLVLNDCRLPVQHLQQRIDAMIQKHLMTLF